MCSKKILQVVFGLALIVALTGAIEADITSDLVGYWPLDGDGTDASGNEFHGTINGNVTPVPDRFAYTDSAMEFDGAASSHVNVGDQPEFQITGAITLAAWVFLNSGNTNNARIIAKAGGGGSRSWSLNIENNVDGLRYPATFQIARDGNTNVSVLDTQSLPTDEWVHMAAVYRPGEVTEVYVNSELRATNTTDIPASQHSNNGLPVLIGARNACGNCGWNGFIDEARVYSRALSPDDILELYQFVPAPRVKAWSPTPPDGADGVTIPLFQWKPGVTAVLHKLYLGTSPDLTEADLSMAPMPLTMHWSMMAIEPGTTYYWRVDEIEKDMVTVHTGDVWQFMVSPLTAYKPQPHDGAKWIDVDADLSWAAGMGAITHDVYFGTDESAVAEGTGDTSKGEQGALTFDPGTLQADTVYYWRVDENVSGGANEGEVWHFTTLGPGGGVKAEYFSGITASGVPILTQVEDAIDHSWGSDEIVAGLSDGVSARWTASLEAAFTETYTLITTSDDGVRLWLDGQLIISNWTDHGTTDDRADVDLVAGQTYSLMMEWYENGGGAIAQLSWESPSQPRQIIPRGPLQLPLKAGTPYPASGAVDVPQALMLHWSAGDQAARHEVYFGQDRDAVAEGTNPISHQMLDQLTYDPGVLEWGTTYYWRVDEVNAANAESPWTGNLWSFTTADFIVVDDFETYTDDSPDRIFQTWLDGFGYTDPDVVEGNGTNATVGYLDPPFAEQTIVHSGRQSMPMDYNNVIPPYYSEAERTWATGQDWTLNGVDALVLYVRGNAANGPDRLYVAVQDSAGRVGIVSHDDTALVTATQWVEWKIPLSELTADGVNVAAVKKMYIGVGNRSAPTPGGAGSLYIDDIRVVRPTAAQ